MLNKKRKKNFFSVIGMLIFLIIPFGAVFAEEEVMCTMEYAPVCGVDGRTYGNECVAVFQNKVKVDYEGRCGIACHDIYAPVCGVDGKTYGNKCYAVDRFGVEIDHEGECENESVMCTEEYAPVCGADGITYSNRCVAVEQKKANVAHEGECRVDTEEEAVFCTMEYAPVCGVDGITYSNECNAGKVLIAHNGECKNEEIEKTNLRAEKLSNNQLGDILAELNLLRNLVLEQQVQINYMQKLMLGAARIAEQMINSINGFIAYGVDWNTRKLGEGERASVIHSYKEAYGKLPENEGDLSDVIKIANGRRPSKTVAAAEEKAKTDFKTVYKRSPDMSNPKDGAAVTIMAYGLRQKAENRNLESEKRSIQIFKNIYKRPPNSTRDWNIVQAISYSGASR
jgi:hypothetical protein